MGSMEGGSHIRELVEAPPVEPAGETTSGTRTRPPTGERLRPRLRTAGSVLLAVLCLWWVFSGVSASQLRHLFEDLHWPLLLLSGMGVVVVSAVKCTKLGILLRPAERLPYRTLFGAETISVLADVLFPLRLLELIRAFVVARHSSRVTVSLVLGVQVVEKASELAVLMLVCLALVLLADLTPAITYAFWGGVGLLLILLAILAWGCLLRPREGGRLLAWMGRRLPAIGRILDQFGRGIRMGALSGRRISAVFAISVVEWALFAGTIWLVGHALGIELGLVGVLGLVLANALSFAFPASSSGSVGIYEVVGVTSLAVLTALPPSEALAVVLLVHLVQLAFGALAGVVGLHLVGLDLARLRRSVPAEPPEVEP
jgi:uncharacterized membrane protein YbhN (UPF0104 family)